MIKWGFFWKSLKQLFIISLISCFILLVGSSVKAWTYYNDINWLIYQPVGDREYLNNYSLLVDSDWDFDSSYDSWYSQLVLYYPPNNWWNWKQVYGWINWKLYYYWDYNNQWVRQWFIKYFMKTTKDNLLDVNNWPYKVWSWNLTADEFYSQYHSFSNIYSINTVWSLNPYLSLHFRTFCLEESNWVDVYCWSCSSDTPLYNCNSQVENSQNYTINDFNDVFNIPYDFSPFWSPTWGGVSWIPWTGSSFNWRIVVDSWYTNHDMVEGFECVGLQPALCYWWFDIDNIFQPDESFEDFTWYIAGEGATIFEIYNLYSGSFSSLNQFLDTVLSRYQNWQINSFKTEPKALLMLGAQMNTAWFKTSYIASYCNLLLNNDNSNIYTWNSVDDLRVQSCLRSKKTKDSLKNSDWEDILFQTTTWWIFWSWDDIDFDPDTFFSSLMEEITTKLDKNLSWGSVWIIPWYIVIFTLAIIFIRLISH